MGSQKNHPGVYLPPPLLYLAAFLIALFIQKAAPLSRHFFHTVPSQIIGILFLLIGFFFIFPAVRQFFSTKNTLITIKPAHSLQTKGIYSISRNPMYVGLHFLYLGISFLAGNWWHIILLPVLFFTVQAYVVKREEQYLEYKFGRPYLDYKLKVRRWL